MSVMSEYQTDPVSGINYATIRRSLENEEAKETYIKVHEQRMKKFKTNEDLLKKAKATKVARKTRAALIGLGCAICATSGAVAATQVVGTSVIASSMSEDVKRDDIYITPTSGRITRKSNHEYVENEAEFLKKWMEDLYEQGWTPDQVAIALSEIYGIRDDRLPEVEGYESSTFLGRVNEKTTAFISGKTHNSKKGVSK